MASIPGQFKLYHIIAWTACLSFWLFAVRWAFLTTNSTLRLFVIPIIPISLGFFLNRRSLGSRIVTGALGGASFELILFLALPWDALLPPPASPEALLMAGLTALVGAFHGLAISFLLYFVCLMIDKFGRGRNRSPSKSPSA
jgi:hypothetical protein